MFIFLTLDMPSALYKIKQNYNCYNSKQKLLYLYYKKSDF